MPDKKPEDEIQEPTKEEQEENTTQEIERSEHYEGMVDDVIRGAMSDDESS